MLGIAVLLLIACLGAAVVSAVVTGLFSLTLISLVLLLGTGAVGLTMQRPRDAEADSVPAQKATVTPLDSRRRAQGGGAQGGGAQGGGGLSRAA